jgi:hypothetical protein
MKLSISSFVVLALAAEGTLASTWFGKAGWFPFADRATPF